MCTAPSSRGTALISSVSTSSAATGTTANSSTLRIKNDQGQKDRQLSKGFLTLNGASRSSCGEMKVESNSLDTRLGTMEVMFVVTKRAVEAAISVELLNTGEFCGEIGARTSSIQESVVLHDSKKVAGGAIMTCNGGGAIQLLRRVVAVSLKEKLEVTAKTGDGENKSTVWFTPRASGGDEVEIVCGPIKMLVKG
nr:unnamed protein product [Digitaria exilis]